MTLRFLPLTLVILVCLFATAAHAAPPNGKPNIVFLLADDLGYGDLGCYGQQKIHTPHLDKMASEGLKFTNFYSGNNVCATSRCALMTGLHTGHGEIRDNREAKPEGQFPLSENAVLIPQLLKKSGYATGAFGKWGLGPVGSTGDPNKHGFDLFYGYNCQRQAHNYYPAYLYRNEKQEVLEGNDGKSATGKVYSHDLVEAEAIKFIDAHRNEPFFLYVPFTIPHVALQVPEDSLAEYVGQWEDPPYEGKNGYLPHKTPRAAYAAMITRMDRTVGRILDRLKELKLDENTIVMFSSDNGAVYAPVGGADPEFFNSTGSLRGFKGGMYEGGLRVPCIARWPGKIKANTSSDLPAVFYDLLPTYCELSGATSPKEIDGVSILPTLLGQTEKQTKHEYLYWESPGYGGQQGIRMGDWKGVRMMLNKGPSPLQLFNLKDDPSEKHDVAKEHPEIVAKLESISKNARIPSETFPLKGLDVPGK